LFVVSVPVFKLHIISLTYPVKSSIFIHEHTSALKPDTNGVSSIMTIGNLIDHLETDVNWHKVFGVVCGVYSDSGFTSRADNFTKSTTIEKALAKFSNLNRVDQIGYDFLYGDLKSRTEDASESILQTHSTSKHKTIKMKNFQGNKKTLEDFKNSQTFDAALILCLTTYQAIIVEDDVAPQSVLC